MSLDADPSFWMQVAAALAPTATGLFGYHKYLENKIATKANKEDVKESFTEVRGEMQWQRENIAKLFDQVRESDQRAQDRFEKILEKL